MESCLPAILDLDNVTRQGAVFVRLCRLNLDQSSQSFSKNTFITIMTLRHSQGNSCGMFWQCVYTSWPTGLYSVRQRPEIHGKDLGKV